MKLRDYLVAYLKVIYSDNLTKPTIDLARLIPQPPKTSFAARETGVRRHRSQGGRRRSLYGARLLRVHGICGSGSDRSPDRRLRPLILTGDGGFQMTGVEIAQTPRYKLNPIVVLLNNGGWGIFRPIAKRHDLLALPSWRYAELARLWGGRGFRAETVGQLRRALEDAAKSSAFAIIEVLIGSRDLSPVTVKYIRAAAKKARIRNHT